MYTMSHSDEVSVYSIIMSYMYPLTSAINVLTIYSQNISVCSKFRITHSVTSETFIPPTKIYNTLRMAEIKN
jgi:hypothetical protein